MLSRNGYSSTGRTNKTARGGGQAWRVFAFCLGVLFLLVFGLVSTGAVQAQERPFRKVWAFELTETSGQGVSFVNRSPYPRDIVVDIYPPDGGGGTPVDTRTVSLRGYETKTVFPGQDTGSGGWGLPVGGNSTPGNDTAYGFVASSEEYFSVMLYPDEMLSGSGSGKSAIWAQNTVTDAWWGQWNYPDNYNSNGREYVFVVNPNDAVATIEIDLHRTDGTAIGANPRTFTLDPFQTRTLFLNADMNSDPMESPAPPDVDTPGKNQNMGLHLTSDLGVNVSVYTTLGTDWDASNDYWEKHSVTGGVYVAYETSCNRSEYSWIDALNGASQSAARMTNPNGFEITVRETWYTDDGSPVSYVTEQVIPPYGTKESVYPESPPGYEDESTGQDHGTARLFRTVESIDDPGNPDDQIGSFHVHVSYEGNIDMPAPYQTDWWWGEFSSSATDSLFLINPYDAPLTINVEYASDPYGGLNDGMAGGTPIVLPAHTGIEFSLPSDYWSVPPDAMTGPSIPSGLTDATLHYYSDMPFPSHVELTYPGPNGDLLCYDCDGKDVDLEVLKTGPVGDQQPNTTVDYEILITNNGSDDSRGWTLTDDLNELLMFEGADPDICYAAPDDYGGVVTCTSTEVLPAGESTTIIITVRIHPDTPVDTSIPNTACVEGIDDDPIEGNNCDDETITTPVTLSSFQSTRTAEGVRFEWSTATEAGNAGFNLYVQKPGGLERLNEQLIASRVVGSVDRQNYGFVASGVSGDTFYLEEVSIRTLAQRHGPFALGQSYGAAVTVDAIDWAGIRAETEGKATLQVEQAIAAMDDDPRIDLLVDRDGVYRVTYEALLAAGFDLAGARSNWLAVVSQGQPVAIRVESGRVFGPGAYIEFYAQAVDTLYTKTNVYTLLVDRDLASRIALDKSRPAPGARPSRSYVETATVDENNAYLFLAPGGDPWYDTLMMAFSTPKSWSFDLALDEVVAREGPATLTVDLWGLSEWPVDPDHHVVVSFNGTQVADEVFDGLIDAPLGAELAGGLLQDGANSLELTLPGDTGADWDMVVLDSYSVSYPRAFVARNGALSFSASDGFYRVGGLSSGSVVVYRSDDNGVARVGRVRTVGRNGTYRATFPGTGGPATYLVYETSALLAPGITAGRPEADITTGTAGYLVISHPDFIEGLAPLVDAREAQGFDVRVVDVNDVYAQFGYGIFGAEAIQGYVAYAEANMGTQMVLLVGGDTYDYLDYLGDGSISFVPSLYAATDFYASFAPVDPLYTDLDGDNSPDLAIGRFPVRTAAELEMMIAKTLSYQGKAYEGTAVIAADKAFSADSESFLTGWSDGWAVERAYIDELGTALARSTLIDGINGNVALTSFVGHSGTSVWTFDGLFSGDDAAALTNHGAPTVVSQWGCWNTYYVSPSYNTMAHRFLLSGDQGAAAVLGSTTISYDFSERALGRILAPNLVEPGISIGAAMQAAKAELAASYPDLADVLLGWTILGDPALVIQP